MFIQTIKTTLSGLEQVIIQLDDPFFVQPCEALSQSTIGEHTRHIIEMFQCLLDQYDTGVIDYDLRKRDKRIQTDSKVAQRSLQRILEQLVLPNKSLLLRQSFEGKTISIATNFHRELLYNLEHCVHHQALIKVALLQFEALEVDATFGVARSTLDYRKQCAQ
ncbi:MAG: hypothetical protein RLZZ500_1712 [Bacteroidota bacterium]|jgi:hypothetical protein